jgi:hypothetical protein
MRPFFVTTPIKSLVNFDNSSLSDATFKTLSLFVFFTEGFSIKLAISLSESKNFIIFSKSLEILSKTFAYFAN